MVSNTTSLLMVLTGHGTMPAVGSTTQSSADYTNHTAKKVQTNQ